MEKPLASAPKLWLNANEMGDDPVKYLNLENVIKNINRYPDAQSKALREAIANYVGIEAKKVICGTGSDEMLKLILEGYTEQRDIVLVPAPSFSEYDRLVEMVKAKIVKVNCNEHFEVDVSALITTQHRTKAKVILLANPNNPTGIRLSNAALKDLHDATDALIVVDEAYVEFSKTSALELLESSQRIVITRTLSKAFGMAALRIGYLMGSLKVIERLLPLKMTYNISGISEAIAIELLNQPQYVRTYVEEITTLRVFAYEALKEIKGLRVIASEANFLCFQLIHRSDYDALMFVYKSQNIVIRDLDCGKYLRVTLTNIKEFMRFLEATKAVIK